MLDFDSTLAVRLKAEKICLVYARESCGQQRW